MGNVIVLGTQWGDEGKGKLVDLLTEFAHVIVRFRVLRFEPQAFFIMLHRLLRSAQSLQGNTKVGMRTGVPGTFANRVAPDGILALIVAVSNNS